MNREIRCRHPYQTWELCHVIYNGLNRETFDNVNSMTEGRFVDGLCYEEKWELFQYLAYDTRQWELENSSLKRPSVAVNPQSDSSMTTDEIIRALVTSQMTLQTVVAEYYQETKDSIQNIKSQTMQIAQAIARLEARDESILNFSESEVSFDGEIDDPFCLKPM